MSVRGFPGFYRSQSGGDGSGDDGVCLVVTAAVLSVDLLCCSSTGTGERRLLLPLLLLLLLLPLPMPREHVLGLLAPFALQGGFGFGLGGAVGLPVGRLGLFLSVPLAGHVQEAGVVARRAADAAN